MHAVYLWASGTYRTVVCHLQNKNVCNYSTVDARKYKDTTNCTVTSTK